MGLWLRWFAVFGQCFLVSTLWGADPAPNLDAPKSDAPIPFDPDWTPRPMEGDDVPWFMKEKDVDWVDGRLRLMDTGRTFNATFRYQHDGKDLRTFKGTALRLGDHGEVGMLYDRTQLRWACTWLCNPLAEPTEDNPTGFTPYLDHSDRRFGLLNTPAPRGTIIHSTPMGMGIIGAESTWTSPAPTTGPIADKNWTYALLAMSENRPRLIAQGQSEQYRGTTRTQQLHDTPWAYRIAGDTITSHNYRLLSHQSVDILLASLMGGAPKVHDVDGTSVENIIELREEASSLWIAQEAGTTGLDVKGEVGSSAVEIADGRVTLKMTGDVSANVYIARSHTLNKESFLKLVETARMKNAEFAERVQNKDDTAKGQTALAEAAANDTREITTRLEKAADDAPYVIDTLTLPYENPYRALMFASAVEFIPRELVKNWRPDGPGDNVIAMATVHGDVWLVDGVDSPEGLLHWKRFASGLYQPMGLKFVGGELVVLERGQLTRLRDNNHDGVSDRAFAHSMAAHVTGGEHSYHTSLVTDSDGDYYFHAGGDTNSPTGGTVMRVSRTQSKSGVFCTGFRHPIGMGVLPDGRITGADQEGNWMPSTRIDIYKKGGFYGDMRAHHREVEPTIYDGPLCWLPRQMDNSAGGQIYVDRDDFGPLSRKMLHLSYGQCRIMELMLQEHAGVDQAGAVDLGLQFLSGVTRGGFCPSDGHLYLVGMDGWQTAAKADGCLQRVRYTGKPAAMPVDLSVERGGISLEFSLPIVKSLDAKNWSNELASDPRHYHVEQWNYLWSKEYGSKRYSVVNAGQEGQDVLEIESVTIESPWKVFLKIRGIQPVMQMQIEYDLVAYATDDARTPLPMKGLINNTIHTTGPAIPFQDNDRVALVGGTLVEREQRYGYWEHALTAAHPEKQITFRNLGWSGDTVWAESRGIFDAPAKGYERLIQQVGELKPTVLILNYGANETWAGPAGLDRFVAQYGKLIDDLTKAAQPVSAMEGDAKSDNLLRVVLIGPLPMESGVGPNPDPKNYNANVTLYSTAIQQLANQRNLGFLDMTSLHDWHQSTPLQYPSPTWAKSGEEASTALPPLTENGMHLSAYGYWRTAPWLAARLASDWEVPSLVLPTKEDAIALISHFDRESQRIRVDAVPEEQAKVDTPLLEYGAICNQLPLPTLEDAIAGTPWQRYLTLTPGTYRLEVDGKVAMRGDGTSWYQGLPVRSSLDLDQSGKLLEMIRDKNELFFHQWRPQNITYLFLFRKHEQGNNAVEIPQFNPLILAAEAEIAKLKRPVRRSYRFIRENSEP